MVVPHTVVPPETPCQGTERTNGPYTLKLGAERVARIVDEIVEWIQTDPTTGLRFDDAGLTVGITTGTGIEGAEVVMNFGAEIGSELTDHLAEVDREIDNKIVEKRRQAQKMPTVLLLDFSRVGVAWIRPGSVWISSLRSKLDNEPYVGLGLMVSSIDSSLPLQLHAVFDPSAPPELHEAFEKIAKHFHLTIEH
jgi:hypothetical protein